MERKIGEIFEYDGELYQCVNAGFSCDDCDIKGDCSDISIGACSGSLRTDRKSVVFKKLEKVGNPIRLYNDIDSLFQTYKLFVDAVIPKEFGRSYSMFPDNSYIKIELKQNQEDMEENKLNLKPFSLEAAKAGKPVCTRDGRKARIICFDVNMTYKNVNYPIVAVIESEDGEESVCSYNEKGKVLVEDEFEYKEDLIMLPEKHEGWVNLYRYSTPIYGTEEKAMSCVGSEKMNEYIGTVKVQWYE